MAGAETTVRHTIQGYSYCSDPLVLHRAMPKSVLFLVDQLETW